MAKQTINLGATANDGTGDPLRTAFDKANDNFTELYNQDSDFTDLIDSNSTVIAELDSDLSALSTVIRTKDVKIIGDETDTTWTPHLTNTGNANLLLRTDTANGSVGSVLGQNSLTVGPDSIDNGYYIVNLGGPHAVSTGSLTSRLSGVVDDDTGYDHDVRRLHEGYFEALDVDDIVMMGDGTLLISDSSDLEVRGSSTLKGVINFSSNAPSTAVGNTGDKAGMMYVDNDFIYRCVADYDSSTNIWRRTAWDESSW